MADAKISQLPVATTPLAGTELVPVVQGGVTVQTTTDAILTGTVPSGTANGVLYLNGSKVVTSGSALTFDGTNLATTGGLFSGDARLGQGGTKDIAVIVGNTAGSGPQIRAVTFNEGMYAPLTSLGEFFVWSPSGSEQMRLDSTGLGIGTSSPGYRLDVVGVGKASSAFAVGDSSGNLSGTFTNESDVSKSVTFNADPANAGASSFMRWNVDGTERMRLDSSGNLGLGVTPSAWGSAYRAIQLFFGGGPFTSNAGAIGFTGNCFHNGTNWIYTSNNAATRYELGPDGGNHRWFTAPSGTAGNAISFTQAMTLEANGNLGVGTTSPNYLLHLNGTPQIQFTNSTTGTTTGDGSHMYLSSSDWWLVNKESAAMVFATNNTERARITSGGSLVVGTAALATTATDGFLYVPTCAGTPTGTPTTQTGTAPIVVDTTNNKLYFYSGGQWRDAGP